MKCPNCASELNGGETVCPHCGASLNAPKESDTAENVTSAPEQKKRKKGLIPTLILAAVLIAGAFCLWFFVLRLPKVDSITLSETETALHIGGETVLTCTILPEEASGRRVRWTSSDETVATVDRDGRITAISDGTCVVTASVGKQAADVAVTVNMLELSETELSLYRKETHPLTCTVYPETDGEKAVAWSSSNESVATVGQDGVVRALSAGECVITASAEGRTAEARVTVSAFSKEETAMLGEWQGVLAEVEGAQKKYAGVLALNEDHTVTLTEDENVITLRWSSFETENHTFLSVAGEGAEYTGFIFYFEENDILMVELSIMRGMQVSSVDLYFQRPQS